MAWHRAEEFKKFLIKLDQEVPQGPDVHLVLDNHATRKTPAIKTWLPAHPRFPLHFTPTGSSWLNMVERWFTGGLRLGGEPGCTYERPSFALTKAKESPSVSYDDWYALTSTPCGMGTP